MTSHSLVCYDLFFSIAAVDTMDPLGFAAWTQRGTRDGYFKQLVVTTSLQTNSLEIYLHQLQDLLSVLLTQEVMLRCALKVFGILQCIDESRWARVDYHPQIPGAR